MIEVSSSLIGQDITAVSPKIRMHLDMRFKGVCYSRAGTEKDCACTKMFL